MEQPEVSSPPSEEEAPWDIAGLDKEVPNADTGRIGGDFFNSDKEWKETLIGKLPDGGSIFVKKNKVGSGYTIIKKPGSHPPKELEGSYTSYFVAEREARNYIAKVIDKYNAKIAAS